MLKKESNGWNERVLVEIYSDDPKVFVKLRSYVVYLNEILSAQTDSGLYIEEMERGLLYIYKNPEIMKKMNDPKKPFVLNLPQFNSAEEKQRNKPSGKYPKENSFFLNENITQDSFPKNGIIIYFVLRSDNEEDILKIFEDFVNFNKEKDFIIERQQPNKLKVTFNTFKSFLNYCQNVEKIFVEIVNIEKRARNATKITCSSQNRIKHPK